MNEQPQPPVASSRTAVRLTSEAYWRYVESNRFHDALVAAGRRRGYQHADCEDLAQDALTRCAYALDAFDWATGVAGLAAWVRGAWRACEVSWRREGRLTVSLNTDSAQEARWSLLASDEAISADEVQDIAEDVRARLALIRGMLTPPQSRCLWHRLNGLTYARIGALEGCTAQGAQYRVAGAVKRLRELPPHLMAALRSAAPSGYWQRVFRLMSRVSVYHAPPSRGRALDREKLARMR